MLRRARFSSATLVALLVAVMLLGACGSDSRDEVDDIQPGTPVPSATPMMVSTPSPALPPSPTSLPTPVPTSTAIPLPTATVISEPTATVTILPTVTITPTVEPVETPSMPAVAIGGALFEVEIAATTDTRTRGLSGRERLAPQTGMLFVFEPAVASAFWMKEMLFPLDFVWIGKDCKVVDVTLNAPAPAPGTPDSSLPIYEIEAMAGYTLEINAGEVEALGIQVGDGVVFSDVEVEGGGC